MRAEAIVFGIAGTLFGLIIGWVLGTQQAAGTARLAAPVQQAAAAAPAQQQQPPPPTIDPDKVKALQTVAQQNPKDLQSRVQLGNMFFDAEQYKDSIQWYEQAVQIDPKDVNVSTDLGVAYYYTNLPDKALTQFDRSLAIDPKHIKTLLNVGIVRAFGKQDFAGAAKAWEQVAALAPDTPEGQAAKKGLEGLKSAHPEIGGGGK